MDLCQKGTESMTSKKYQTDSITFKYLTKIKHK